MVATITQNISDRTNRRELKSRERWVEGNKQLLIIVWAEPTPSPTTLRIFKGIGSEDKY